MTVSTAITCCLAIVAVCANTASGQFTLTGFPLAATVYAHTVTCNYPGASSYTWRFRGGTYTAAEYSFTVNAAIHDGLWQCEAVVNGVIMTEKTNLLTYCNGVYVTSATTTNPTIGDSIDLNCKVISPTGGQVEWYMTAPDITFRTKSIAEVTASGCEYDHNENDNIRFTPSTICKPSTSNQFFNLHIKKVNTSHEGYWRCYDYGNACYSEPVRIAIARPPKDPPTLTGFDNPILGTNLHKLTCDAWQPSVRPLTYNWYKDGVQISSGNESTWRLQPVKQESNGKYKCEVVDKVTNVKVEAEDTLTVCYVASWNPAIEHVTETPAVIGQSVILTLNILAYPLPTSIKWYKEEGNTLTFLNYVTTKLSDTTWILTIPFVHEDDYGGYNANVTNAAGSAIFSFNLTRSRPYVPDAPSNLKILVKITNDLIVTFTPGFNGGAPQTFTVEYYAKDRHPQVIRGIQDPTNTSTVTYTIGHLSADTMYYIKVKAVNQVGGSNFTETSTVQTEASVAENVVTAGEAAGAVVSVILFVILVTVVVLVFIVVMQKRNINCFAGQRDTQAPALDHTVTNSVGGVDAVNITNQAFEGESDPIYVNHPSQGKDCDAEVYEDMATPYNPYADLKITTKAGVEEQPYETLKIA